MAEPQTAQFVMVQAGLQVEPNPPSTKPVAQEEQVVAELQRTQFGTGEAQVGVQRLLAKVKKGWQLVHVDMSEQPWQYWMLQMIAVQAPVLFTSEKPVLQVVQAPAAVDEQMRQLVSLQVGLQ